MFLPVVLALLAVPWILTGLTLWLYPKAERAWEQALYHRAARALVRAFGGELPVARHYQRLQARIRQLERTAR